jgi:hypothetical protein
MVDALFAASARQRKHYWQILRPEIAYMDDGGSWQPGARPSPLARAGEKWNFWAGPNQLEVGWIDVILNLHITKKKGLESSKSKNKEL